MSRWTKIVITLALAALAAPQAGWCTDLQTEHPAARHIHPGQQVVVKFHTGLGKPIGGVFLASEAEGLRLELQNGEEMTLPWERIRKVEPKRNWYRSFLTWIARSSVKGLWPRKDPSSRSSRS
jgi:hypothetical protein